MTAPPVLASAQPPSGDDGEKRRRSLAKILTILAGTATAAAIIRNNRGSLGDVGEGLAKGGSDLAQVWGRAKLDAERRRRQDATDLRQQEEHTWRRGREERDRIADEARFDADGVVTRDKAKDTTLELPNVGSVGGGLGLPPSLDVTIPASARYRSLPGTDRLRDTMGPQTKERSSRVVQEFAKRKEGERARGRRLAAVIVTNNRRKLQLSREEMEAIADDETAFRQLADDARRPDPFASWKQKRDYVNANPAPSRSSSASSDPGVAGRRKLTTIERQIGDTDQQIREITREIARQESATDPAKTAATRAQLAQQRRNLTTRRDSLNSVRDSLAGEMTRGVSVPVSRSPASQTEPETQLDEDAAADMQAEFDDANRRFQRIVASGVDPKKAQTALQKTLTQIARKYGALGQ